MANSGSSLLVIRPQFPPWIVFLIDVNQMKHGLPPLTWITRNNISLLFCFFVQSIFINWRQHETSHFRARRRHCSRRAWNEMRCFEIDHVTEAADRINFITYLLIKWNIVEIFHKSKNPMRQKTTETNSLVDALIIYVGGFMDDILCH